MTILRGSYGVETKTRTSNYKHGAPLERITVTITANAHIISIHDAPRGACDSTINGKQPYYFHTQCSSGAVIDICDKATLLP